MNVDELRALNGAIKLAWPGQSWPELTVRAVAPRAADVDLATAQKALGALFDEGREFPPSPSVVLAKARAMAKAIPAAAYHQIAAPDATRLPDADELARMERQRPRLRAAAAALARRGQPVSQVLPDVVDRLGDEVPPASSQPITEED